jgi:nucleotide-binding universal stress UspA family protein
VFHEVVVGMDGSEDAAAMLQFGFGEACAREARLTALRIWANPRGDRIEGYHDWMMSVGPLNAAAAALLAKQVAPWQLAYPDVLVTESTVHGQPGRALVLASGHADLIVIGGSRVGPALILSPVAEALLHHAQCPVAIIPNGKRSALGEDRKVLLSATA